MPLSSFTGLTDIPDPSDAVPSLFNTRFSILSQNLDQLNADSTTSFSNYSASIFSNLSNQVFNVLDYGALGDNSNDDTTSIRDALSALTTAGGGTLYFPPGTYLIATLIAISNETGINMTGAYPASQIRRSGSINKIISFDDCADISIQNLVFDANNVETFGGISFVACQRVYVRNNRYYDSDATASDNTDDYSWTMSRCTDVWIEGNLIEDLQLEPANSSRVHILNNTIK